MGYCSVRITTGVLDHFCAYCITSRTHGSRVSTEIGTQRHTSARRRWSDSLTINSILFYSTKLEKIKIKGRQALLLIVYLSDQSHKVLHLLLLDCSSNWFATHLLLFFLTLKGHFQVCNDMCHEQPNVFSTNENHARHVHKL